MNNIRMRSIAAAGVALALGLSACGGGTSTKTTGSTGSATKDAFNAGLTQVFNPSEKKGGIVKFADEAAPDSLDPGDTYYGAQWDFIRIYGRALTMFKPAPGKAGAELVPDLAENLGVPSDGGKTWTYKLRKGVKFEDGTPVKAVDVKYGVLRSMDKGVFPDGPTYFEAMLSIPKGYKGPYKSKGMNTDSAITTPDDSTIVFHLTSPFAGFDYLAQLPQTIPVPEAKDTGAKYKSHVVSSGPYMFASYAADKSYTLKRNPNWDKATDPNRKALPDGYDVQLNVNAEDIDNRLISGDLDVAFVGTGLTAASQSKVLSDPALKARTDNPTLSRLNYTSINPTVKPLDNIECRTAIQYAMDRTSYQTAYGGAFSGGALATTILPPIIPGYQKYDLFPAGAGSKGDVTKAKEALTKCGQPNGFATNIAYRNERPKEKATAEAFQQALAKVGIKLTLKGYAKADYYSSYAGNPPYVKANNLGLGLNSWGADWPDGFGFLSQIVDSRVIRETGGSSNTSVRIPEVDKLLDQGTQELDTTKRNAVWGQIDKRVMEEAVIYPGIYAKSLLMRGKNLTNVFVNESLGYYDYLALGKP
jgi:peptide/nickel transport system substrate-binding protein